MTPSPELTTAIAAAEAGAAVALRHFRELSTLAMRHKETYNLVSDADVEAEVAAVEVIRRAFSGHQILGEELHHDEITSEHLWIIDPIDGTNNFAHGVPHFATSVAYYHRGAPVCGVVCQPVAGDLFVAERGQGAYLNGTKVTVGGQARLDQSLIAVGFFYDRGEMMEKTLLAIGDLFRQNIHGIRRFGAATLDLCWVGAGRYQAFFEYRLAPWDFAAARLFVEEAGGRVTTCRGESLPLTHTHLLATNSLLHDAILEIVTCHLPLTNS